MASFNIGNKKLSQEQSLMNYMLQLGSGLHLLDAPTGSGKTYASGVIANTKKTLIISPYVSLTCNIYTELNSQLTHDISVCYGNTHDWSGDTVIATYDKMVNADIEIIKAFDIILIDEPQSIYEDSYRLCMGEVYDRLHQLSSTMPIIALSATVIDDLMPIFNRIEVTCDYEFTPNITISPENKKGIDTYIMNQARIAETSGQTLCVLLNNKEKLDLLADKLRKKYNIKSTCITADTKDYRSTKELLDTQICNTPVLLMTKAAQAGISILNSNLLELVAVLDSGMTPESIKQFYSRFRKVSSPKLKLLKLVSINRLDDFIASTKRTPHFDVMDTMEQITNILKLHNQTLQALWHEYEKHNDIAYRDAVEQTLDALKRSQYVSKDINVASIEAGLIVNKVTASQKTEQARREFYYNNLGSLARELKHNVVVDGIDSHLITGEDDSVDEMKDEAKRLKQIAKDELERVFMELLNGEFPEEDEGIDRLENRRRAKAYGDAYNMYHTMTNDLNHIGVDSEEHHKIMNYVWNEMNIKTPAKYKRIGSLIIKHYDVFVDIFNNAKEDMLVGRTKNDTPCAVIEYYNLHDVIDIWLDENSNHTFTNVFKDFTKADKRKLFGSLFNLKRTGTNGSKIQITAKHIKM